MLFVVKDRILSKNMLDQHNTLTIMSTVLENSYSEKLPRTQQSELRAVSGGKCLNSMVSQYCIETITLKNRQRLRNHKNWDRCYQSRALQWKQTSHHQLKPKKQNKQAVFNDFAMKTHK